MRKSTKLRKLLEGEDLVRIVGAHDGLTAKLVELNGFEGVWASGLEVSTSHVVPDANILTMTDYLRAASIMNAAVSIPVVVDADTGYGNSSNFIHAVKKFEAEGIAAVCIEDKQFPKVNSFVPWRQDLAPISEFVGKIMAGKNAQETDDFMIFARVEALIAGLGIEEALKRAHAYEEAGCDGVFIHSKQKKADEILEFVERWDGNIPLIVCPTTYPDLTVGKARKLEKIRMIIFANHGIRAEIQGINKILTKLERKGDIRRITDEIASMETVFELQGMPLFKELENRYNRKQRPVNAVVLAAGDDSKIPSLKTILQDTPLSMLDVNGKTVLQRNVDTLKKSGIQDVSVVVGYLGDKVESEGISMIENPDYKRTHILHSLMLALDKTDCGVLMAFTDILFDENLVERLLKQDDEIVLVIDKSFKMSNIRKEDIDLVVTCKTPLKGPRCMESGRINPIKKIGKKIPRSQAGYEFIGVALLSEDGVEKFKKYHAKAAVKYAGKPFHEAPSFEKASFTDMIQELIDCGVNVSSMEVSSGWTEIHNFEDYKRACEMLAHK